MRQSIFTPDAPPPAGPYSQGLRVGDLVFAAGQGPFDQHGRRTGTTFEEQVEAVLDNLEQVARAAGGSLNDAVRLGVYIRDLADFQTLNEVLARRLNEPYPVRTTIPVPLVGFDIEIDAWLAIPRGGDA